jgi:hypothetical protein
MKKLRIKLAVAAVLGVLSITPAMATPVLDTNGSVLMGIKGVQVGGAFYDVSFGDTATTAADTFVFSTSADALIATRALMSLFDTTGVAGAYGDGAMWGGEYKIKGMDSSRKLYAMFTWFNASQFAYDYDYRSLGGGLVEQWGEGGYYERLGDMKVITNGQQGVDYDDVVVMESMLHLTNAVWRLSSPAQDSSVPEPTSLALLGIGVLGYVGSRRKSKSPT